MKTLTALKALAIIFAVIIVVLLGVLIFYNPAKAPGSPTSPLVTLVSSDGALMIPTSSLENNKLITSPFSLTGTVTGGGWFFEATFPVTLLDANGNVIASTTARAATDWTSVSRSQEASRIARRRPGG